MKRTQRIALGHLHEIFFEEETDDGKRHDGSAIMDGKCTFEKAATADHKGDFFTKKLHPAQFNHALNFIRIGCKAIAPPPKPPTPDRPNFEMLRRAAVSSSTRQRRWGNNAGNQVIEKKANPEINIPEITTKAATAIIIKNNLTEKDDKIADKYGAPPPPPEEQCPAHLGYVCDPAASASREHGSPLPQRSGGRGAGAEDGPAEDAPTGPLRQQPCEASGTDLEAAPAGAPLARDDHNDGDGELNELDTDGTGSSQARLSGVGRRPGRALLNGNSLAAPLTEPESSITSRDFSKEGNMFVFAWPRARF